MKLVFSILLFFFLSFTALAGAQDKGQGALKPAGGDYSHPQRSNHCPSSTYKMLSDRFGEMAVLKLDRGNLKDYRMGGGSGFPINCARIFVNMGKIPGTKIYEGAFTVAYDDGKVINFQKYESGYGLENKYNRWVGGFWEPDRNGLVNQKFHAIYEDEDAALIFKIDHIEARDGKDGGGEDLYAYGEVYYKMFRYSPTAGRGDVCWGSGAYMRDFESIHPPRRAPCWQQPTGPFSCRPEGILEPRAPVTDIDLTGGLSCYKRLGIFRNLHIKRAFNVGDIKDL